MNKSDFSFLFIIVCICLVSGHYTVKIIKDAYNIYSAENKCIAEHVSKGVERKNIVRMNGTCAVKE